MNIVSERQPWLSARDAAARLGVAPSRVRALAESGQLQGRKVGRQWVFSAAEVDKCASRPRLAGRPLSEAASLGLLFELSGEPASWLDRVAKWKVLHSQAARDPQCLVARSGRRAERIELRAHPSDLPRVLAEQGVMRSGVSAAREYGIDLAAPGVIEIYVDRQRARELKKRYSLVPSGDPNVLMHVVAVPAALAGREVMPLGVAVVDLLESGESRAGAAARRAWKRLARP